MVLGVLAHQRHAADEDHSYDRSFEVFVLDQSEGLDAEAAPALPEWRLVVAAETGKPRITPIRAAVGRILLHQKLLQQNVPTFIKALKRRLEKGATCVVASKISCSSLACASSVASFSPPLPPTPFPTSTKPLTPSSFCEFM